MLPTFAQLTNPSTAPGALREQLAGIDKDAASPANLGDVHWWNTTRWRPRPRARARRAPGGADRRPRADRRALGDRFPMIGAHKVLAAYGCLAPRLVTGQFDPATARSGPRRATTAEAASPSRASWAAGRRGAARGHEPGPFRVARAWVGRPGRHHPHARHREQRQGDLRRVRGSPRTRERGLQPVLRVRQHLVHFTPPARRSSAFFGHRSGAQPDLACAAFVSATGSAGTIAAGDYLKERLGARIVAVEALECPTMLYNGYGEHNIQGIGDKHIPLIHNVHEHRRRRRRLRPRDRRALRARSTPRPAAPISRPRRALRPRRRPRRPSGCRASATSWPPSSSPSASAGPDDVMVTVATDGAAMYESERARHSR